MSALRFTIRIHPEHPALPGHFPGHPIVPGAVLLDEVLHALESTPMRAAIANAAWHVSVLKFHQSAHAGDRLQLDCTPEADSGRTQFRLTRGATLIASGSCERRQTPERTP